MIFDIKDVKSWATRHDVKVGDEGYFADEIEDLKEENNRTRMIAEILDDHAFCFRTPTNRYSFFLPLNAAKKEKKYRPLKSIDEMDCLFDCSVMSAKNFLTYRNKASGKIYIELLFSVCRDKDDILRSINNIPVQNLFNYFEIRKNGEWLPFGVEVKEND